MARNLAPRTAGKALAILDTIISIAKTHRLAHGVYVVYPEDEYECRLRGQTPAEIVEEYLDVKPLCNGPLACLVGSALLGAGVDPNDDQLLFDRMVSPYRRQDVLNEQPQRFAGLKLALTTLDEQAAKLTEVDTDEHDEPGFAAEDYFEDWLPSSHGSKTDDEFDQQHVIDLCRKAKRTIKARTKVPA